MDEADLAQIVVEQALAQHLAAHRARQHAREAHPLGTPWTDAAGQRLCLDCGEPIDPRRLAALPGCIRCCDCQELVEDFSA